MVKNEHGFGGIRNKSDQEEILKQITKWRPQMEKERKKTETKEPGAGVSTIDRFRRLGGRPYNDNS